YPLADYNITPDIAIVDPEIAETMPKTLTAHTGMDALTHAIEAYVSTVANDFTDPLALKAIKMVYETLYSSYEGSKIGREKMHYAQCLAGMAFSNALLGIVHSMAHKTGAAFEKGHIPHGCANAMYLPQVIRFNAKDERAEARYAEIATSVGLKGETTAELVANLIKSIEDCNVQLSIPATIKDFENGMISEEEFLGKVDEIAFNAVGDACTGSNPRQPSVEEMKELLKCCFYGNPCNF
ncbi:MAG: iron-containing alcohol dehydrogenase, partial [Clostridia bacterium]